MRLIRRLMSYLNPVESLVPSLRDIQAPRDGGPRRSPQEILCELGLQVDEPSYDWRCGACNVMQRPGATSVWVPDAIQRHDDLDALLGVNRRNKWSGESTSWCVSCVRPILRRGDIEGALRAAHDRKMKRRVQRLEAEGERAGSNPSKTVCKECGTTCGYLAGWCATFGGSYTSVMCPSCGWEGWEKTSDSGLVISHGHGDMP